MAEGTSTFHGMALPLYGESEIKQQTAASDILTITGANSQSGDFLVLQDSGGVEKVSWGTAAVTQTNYPSIFSISSTTSTNYGIKFSMGASAVASALIDYTAGITAATTAYLGVASSNGPTYLLSVSGSAGHGVGAAANNGFFTASKFFTAAPSTTTVIGAIKMLAGSKAYYVLSVPDTTLT